MPDVFSKKKRSEVMSLIRSRGNKDTELALMRVFRAQGITGWRRQVVIAGKSKHRTSKAQHSTSKAARAKDRIRCSTLNVGRSLFALRVRPDFVFRAPRVAVFVDGCFWHGCPLHATRPRGNAVFWRKKFAVNRLRDQLVTRALRRGGWRVLRIWEHELARKNASRLLGRIRRVIMSA